MAKRRPKGDGMIRKRKLEPLPFPSVASPTADSQRKVVIS